MTVSIWRGVTKDGTIVTAWSERKLKELGAVSDVGKTALPSIIELVLDYYEFRKLTLPDTEKAMLFLASETGELADEVVSLNGDWVRNNPEKERGTFRKILREGADVLMMDTMVLREFGTDPLEAMIEKFQSKGWTQG